MLKLVKTQNPKEMFVSCFVVCMCVEFIVHELMLTACASMTGRQRGRREESGVSGQSLVGKVRKTKAKQGHVFSYKTFYFRENMLYKQAFRKHAV